MRIALVCRDYGLARPSPVARGVLCTAESLVAAGHTVRVVAQRTPQLSSFEARGRLTIHRVALPAPIVSWTRVLLDFAIEAARHVCELSRIGEIDVAEFPDQESPAAAIALLGSRTALRPPYVIALHDTAAAPDRAPGAPPAARRLGLTSADGVVRADATADERERVYQTVIDRCSKGAGVFRASDGLDAWRRVARSLGGGEGSPRNRQESVA